MVGISTVYFSLHVKDKTVAPLSDRQIEVAALVSRGLTDEEIAHRLEITAGTVKQHTNRIYQKLGFGTEGNSRVRLVIWFMTKGAPRA